MVKLGFTALLLVSSQAFSHTTPVDLLGVITQAKQSDPAYYAALNTGRSVEMGEAQARAALLPTVTGGYSWNKSRSHAVLTGIKERTHSQSISAVASQSLINVKNWDNFYASKAGAESARMTINYAQQTLLYGVSTAYFAQASAQQALTIQKEQVRVNKQLLQLTQQRYQAGQSLLSDVLMEKTALIASKIQLLTVKNAVASASSALSLHLSGLVKKVKPIQGDFLPTLKRSYNRESWGRMAIRKNPNILAMRFRMVAAKKSLDAAKAAYYPTLSSSLGYSRDRSVGRTLDTNTTIRGRSTSESIGLNLTIPLYQGGALFAQIKAARYQFYAARNDWQFSKRQALTSLYASFESLKNTISIIKQQDSSMDLYKKNLSVERKEYELGHGTLIDVQQAVRTLYSAKLSLLQSEYQFLADYVNCKYQMGLLGMKDIKAINQWMLPHG